MVANSRLVTCQFPSAPLRLLHAIVVPLSEEDHLVAPVAFVLEADAGRVCGIGDFLNDECRFAHRCLPGDAS
jgi:hypothetical protein